MDGKFFGLTRDGQKGWYVFGTRARDIHFPTMEGFVAHFEIHDGQVTDWKEVVSGLDNGVHQIMFYNNHLYILETYIQRILKVSVHTWKKEFVYPCPPAISPWYFINDLEGSFQDYVHMNALTVQDDRFYIMCPKLRNSCENGKPTQERNPSIIKVFSNDWKLIDELDTGRFFCHDLVMVGHEIYFADATNTICKMNIVTREVSEVWTVDPFSPHLRKICRGLSIGQDGKVLVGTHDFDNHDFLVDVIAKEQITFPHSPCCIKRLDVFDFNDETCPLRTSQIVCTRTHVTEEIYIELVKILEKNPREGTELGDITTFLNPTLDSDRQDFCLSRNVELLKNESLQKAFPYGIEESGKFYLYPKGHGMGWHTNSDNIVMDSGQFKYRMYTVRTTGESYFLYRHTISKKIHAVRDVDGTSIVFNLVVDSEPFWHAVLCKTGTRLSYGVKFGREILKNMSIPDIWELETSEPTFSFDYIEINKNITNYYRFPAGISIDLCNYIRAQVQDAPLMNGTVGGNQRVVEKIRNSRVFWIPKIKKFLDIYSVLFTLVGRANDVFFKFNLHSINGEIQYTEYNENYKGHYDWHLDVGSCMSRRKLSVVVQLSDPSEYEGGELQIKTDGNDPITVEKEKGTVIIFPSYLLHRVTPVTKGTRRSLVLWVEGPPFK